MSKCGKSDYKDGRNKQGEDRDRESEIDLMGHNRKVVHFLRLHGNTDVYHTVSHIQTRLLMNQLSISPTQNEDRILILDHTERGRHVRLGGRDRSFKQSCCHVSLDHEQR